MLLRRKNEILLLAATGMDFECITLAEISQIEKDKVLCVESKKQKKIVSKTKKQTHRHREQTSGYQ